MTINGGAIDDTGTLLVSGSSEIENATVNGGDVGGLTVNGGVTLTLDEATLENLDVSNNGTLQVDDNVALSGVMISGGAIDDTGALLVSGSSEIENATINGGGDIAVNGGQILTLDAVTLENLYVINDGTLKIDDSVTLSGVTINGGTIDDTGTLLVSGSSEIENATVNGGDVGGLTVNGGVTLTLDDATLENLDVTNNGTLQVDDNVALSGVMIAAAPSTIPARCWSAARARSRTPRSMAAATSP